VIGIHISKKDMRFNISKLICGKLHIFAYIYFHKTRYKKKDSVLFTKRFNSKGFKLFIKDNLPQVQYIL